MLAKLAKTALIASGTVMTFAAGVGTGAVLIAYVVLKAGPLIEEVEKRKSESDSEDKDPKDETSGRIADAPVKDFSEL